MALTDEAIRERLTHVFARQDFSHACKRGDAGAMITILMDHGVTQGWISARTGLAQSTLSNYKRGKHDAKFASTLRKLADGLDMPLPLRQALGLSDEHSPDATCAVLPAGVPADTYDLQLLAEAIGKNGTGLTRRELLTLAGQLSATLALRRSGVWEHLAYALTNPRAIDESVVRQMEAQAAGFHHLEEVASAAILARGLAVHLKEVGTLLNGIGAESGNNLSKRLITVAGESSVLAGWLASDVGDSVTARNFYDTAMQAAERADDPAIAACALTYRSYVPSTKGANGRARLLLTEALGMVSEDDSPATVAWIAARHAEESANVGDKVQALASWARAEEAFSMADPDEDRVWTRFLDQDRFDSYRIATYSKIGKVDEAQEVAAQVLTRLNEPYRKTAAIIYEDIATAQLARGAVNEASQLAQNGLAILRETGFNMRLPRFDAIARGLQRYQRQPHVRAYLEEFTMTRRQLAASPR